MCDIKFESGIDFYPTEVSWDDRLRAERTALVETYLTGVRHYAPEFSENLPQGPLTEVEATALDDFSARLGEISLRKVS